MAREKWGREEAQLLFSVAALCHCREPLPAQRQKGETKYTSICQNTAFCCQELSLRNAVLAFLILGKNGFRETRKQMSHEGVAWISAEDQVDSTGALPGLDLVLGLTFSTLANGSLKAGTEASRLTSHKNQCTHIDDFPAPLTNSGLVIN